MMLPESVLKYQHEIWQAIGETFVMVGISIAAKSAGRFASRYAIVSVS